MILILGFFVGWAPEPSAGMMVGQRWTTIIPLLGSRLVFLEVAGQVKVNVIKKNILKQNMYTDNDKHT